MAGIVGQRGGGAVLGRLRALVDPGPSTAERTASRVEVLQLAHAVEHGAVRAVM